MDAKRIRVLGISGSARTKGNTERLIRRALSMFEVEGFETDFLSLAEHPVKPCMACGRCLTSEVVKCYQDDPAFEGILERFAAAHGILVGSPVYFGSAAPQVMALLDRVGYVARRHPELLRRKVGAAVVVARRAGQNFTFAQINYFFLIAEMIVPGSTYWNIAFGREKGEVENDQEGIRTLETLAENMAWLLKKLA